MRVTNIRDLVKELERVGCKISEQELQESLITVPFSRLLCSTFLSTHLFDFPSIIITPKHKINIYIIDLVLGYYTQEMLTLLVKLLGCIIR